MRLTDPIIPEPTGWGPVCWTSTMRLTDPIIPEPAQPRPCLLPSTMWLTDVGRDGLRQDLPPTMRLVNPAQDDP